MSTSFDKKVGPFLKTLGFKFDDQFQWVLGKDKNITVNGDKVSMIIRLSSLYNHKSRFGSRTVNIEDGKKYLKDNIKELKQLEKDPNNKKLGDALSKKLKALKEVDDERTLKSKSLRFKNMWLHYNFSKPAKATKGILYSVDVKDMQQLNKDALAIVSPILKAQKFKRVDTGFNDGISYYEPVNKKESKKIPYVKDLVDSQDEDDLDWGGIEMAGIIVNCYKGRYKGVGKDASLYYFVLMIGGFTVDDTEDPAVAVEVITPLDKGEQFFLDEVKKAVSKLNIWKFTGKPIKVNKCSKAVTGSAESKVFAYHGQVITASSKEEAIQKIVADSKKPKIDMKVVNKWAKKNMDITDWGLGKDHWKNKKTGEVYYTLKAAKRLSKKVPGYHLPSAEEWNELAEACGGVCINPKEKNPCSKDYDGCFGLKKLNIKPAGRYSDGFYYDVDTYSYFWTSTDFACRRYLDSKAFLYSENLSDYNGFSVRLVKD